MNGHVWPDGRGLMDQPNLLVEAWSIIGDATQKAKKGQAQ